MHASTTLKAHPFGMLADPQAIQRALESSQRLECLSRRICRPLDKVMVPVESGAAVADASGGDTSIDATE